MAVPCHQDKDSGFNLLGKENYWFLGADNLYAWEAIVINEVKILNQQSIYQGGALGKLFRCSMKSECREGTRYAVSRTSQANDSENEKNGILTRHITKEEGAAVQ